MATQATDDFRKMTAGATEVNLKMDNAMRKADTLHTKMAEPEKRMNASISRQMSPAEWRMKQTLPKVMDAYVERKIGELRSGSGAPWFLRIP